MIHFVIKPVGEVSADGVRIMCVADDGDMLGMLEVRPRRYVDDRTSSIRYAEITVLRVDEAYRRRGIGAALVQHARNWAAMAGFERVAVESTANEDKPAPGFYRAAGFTARSIIWDVAVNGDG